MAWCERCQTELAVGWYKRRGVMLKLCAECRDETRAKPKRPAVD